MSWKIFNVKYDKRETWAFEQMSYLLFCAEFENRIGLFRYKNQTGIETEPIEKDGKYYGFQSKYYTTLIADNKDDIIDSIKKAKSKNNHLPPYSSHAQGTPGFSVTPFSGTETFSCNPIDLLFFHDDFCNGISQGNEILLHSFLPQ